MPRSFTRPALIVGTTALSVLPAGRGVVAGLLVRTSGGRVSFSDSPTVCPTISLGVQAGKVSGAGGRIVVAVPSTTGFWSRAVQLKERFLLVR